MKNDKNAKKQDNSTIVNHKKIFFCRKCYYFTCNRKDYKKHIVRKKHLEKSDGNDLNFSCPKCYHISFNPGDAFNHRKNCKKKNPQKVPLRCENGGKIFGKNSTIMVRGQIVSEKNKNDKFYPKNPQKIYKCVCNKTYKYQSGLCRHKLKCPMLKTSKSEKNDKDSSENSKKIDTMTDIFKTFMKNQINTNEKLTKLISQPQNIYYDNKNIINNKGMTINVYLNEICKGAMSLQDFIDKIQVSLEDIDYSRRYGFAKGITNILVKRLETLQQVERPIYCANRKKLQFYIKDENEWVEDVDHKKIDSSIRTVKYKQIKALKEWENKNPNFLENEQLLKQWNEIMSNILEDSQVSKDTNSKLILKNLSKYSDDYKLIK